MSFRFQALLPGGLPAPAHRKDHRGGGHTEESREIRHGDTEIP